LTAAQDALLRGWGPLNAHLRAVQDDRALLPLLRRAVESGARAQVMDRLYQRYSHLRRQRERAALIEAVLNSREGREWEFPL
jgi:hypothetical protein